MNSSHRANRSGRGQHPGRGRGRGGGRGAFNNSSDFSGMKPVPNIRQVVVGAPVSIVLKVDQPTGREVQGMVAELLTRGDHPRGIKVRLQDGRVGRVQRMVSDETAMAASAGLSDLGRNGEVGGNIESSGRVTVSGSGFTQRYSDFRIDEPDAPPSGGLSLEDYVVVKETKKGWRKKGSGTGQHQNGIETAARENEGSREGQSVTSATSKCPVCSEFEGDETAVAHHVNEHFD
ncbi:hypothetical protein G7Y89_g2327 [Cudoniella acicularis]|uniref:Uncharacterized protein n=1 Tax=Cudoniella acicularis TaxID=354080 RepID=A0A8H4W672_9HELO|nr:hypothetical protein G7Y89_g2327 [Cudoniella acicularis]